MVHLECVRRPLTEQFSPPLHCAAPANDLCAASPFTSVCTTHSDFIRQCAKTILFLSVVQILDVKCLVLVKIGKLVCLPGDNMALKEILSAAFYYLDKPVGLKEQQNVSHNCATAQLGMACVLHKNMINHFYQSVYYQVWFIGKIWFYSTLKACLKTLPVVVDSLSE